MKLLEELNKRGRGHLPGLMGIVIDKAEPGLIHAHLDIRPELMAPNGYLHAGTVVTLADTACGYGCVASLPEGANGFTTIELKSNFMGTAREGGIACVATVQHRGRKTQLWDAIVTERGSGKAIALFRCTQMILYPKAKP